MHNINLPCLALVINAALASQATLAERGYEGYSDVLDEEPWFDGVKSTIEYVEPTAIIADVCAWAGVNNNADQMAWLQTGWGQRPGETAKIYWEYTTQNDVWRMGFGEAPTTEGQNYQVSHEENNAEWTNGGVVYKTVVWEGNFDNANFNAVYYGAEVNNREEDHVPGVEDNKNNFRNSEARKVGEDFSATGLSTERDSAVNGHVEKSPANSDTHFATWYAE
ncbi:hypothetical protein [Teredinibacter purpureus]|uniref:hypothetical protein n=1 Tax=Teredinibacter purpureus TaxID=2731756 RepID=UPI0005F76586|nr:hypothetical protein [Teredinibacter purpureus]